MMRKKITFPRSRKVRATESFSLSIGSRRLLSNHLDGPRSARFDGGIRFILLVIQWVLQVLEERIVHINSTPPVPEPYYVPTGNEAQPKPVGEECGVIVYQYYPISAVNYVRLLLSVPISIFTAFFV